MKPDIYVAEWSAKKIKIWKKHTPIRNLSLSLSAHFRLQRREVDWEKVPFVPRPSLISDPITAFGKRQPRNQEKKSILDRINRESIKPSQDVLNRPIQPYISARDATRNRVMSEVRRVTELRDAGGSAALVTDRFNMDNVLPRLHNTAGVKTPHRHLFFVEPSKYWDALNDINETNNIIYIYTIYFILVIIIINVIRNSLLDDRLESIVSHASLVFVVEDRHMLLSFLCFVVVVLPSNLDNSWPTIHHKFCLIISKAPIWKDIVGISFRTCFNFFLLTSHK